MKYNQGLQNEIWNMGAHPTSPFFVKFSRNFWRTKRISKVIVTACIGVFHATPMDVAGKKYYGDPEYLQVLIGSKYLTTFLKK